MSGNSKFVSLKNELSSPKTRMTVIATVGVLMISFVAGGIFYWNKSSRLLPPKSSISNTTPEKGEGESTEITEHYSNVIKESNRLKAEEARLNGTSAMPKVIPEVSKREFAFNTLQEKKENEENIVKPEELNTQFSTPDFTAETQGQGQQQNIEQVNALKERMKGSLAQLANNEWSGYGVQLRTVSNSGSIDAYKEKENSRASISGSVENGNNATPKMILKAGKICYSELTTGLNSDDSMWASAKIIQCEAVDGTNLAGSVLSGTGVIGSDWASGVQFTFNQMTSSKYPKSFSVQAISLDENTGRPAVKSDKNNHMFSKVLSAAVLGIAEGVADGLKDGGRNEQVVSGNNSDIVQKDRFSNKQLAVIGGANAVKVASEPLSNVISRPATYSIENSRAIGIYFMSDVILN